VKKLFRVAEATELASSVDLQTCKAEWLFWFTATNKSIDRLPDTEENDTPDSHKMSSNDGRSSESAYPHSSITILTHTASSVIFDHSLSILARGRC
jgi:hypothetical protein